MSFSKPDPNGRILSLPRGHDTCVPMSELPDWPRTSRSGQPDALAHSEALSTVQSVSVIVTLAGITSIACVGTGILTTALPRIAADIGLSDGLLLWPASAYALTSGCTLLAFGSLADFFGPKRMWLGGSVLTCVLVMACGLSRTGIQLILFRALSGIAISMCLPSSMSLITGSFPEGSKRNLAFAINGMGQPIGYALGLILGGVLTDTIGWRYGFYITAAIEAGLSVVSYLALPKDKQSLFRASTWQRAKNAIDWVGLAMISLSFGVLSYELAIISQGYKNLEKSYNIILLVLSLLLLPAFAWWVSRQEQAGKPVLIPNSIWKGRPFLTVCIMMFFTEAAFNAFQYQSTLYFQDIQQLSALQASIRFLPMAVIGIITNVATGYLVDKIDVNLLVSSAAFITAISPLIMALANPSWSYWRGSFIPMALSPLSCDVLYTVSSLIISHVFPPDSQALAGGIFNTAAQLGNSIGLAVTAAIAASVTNHIDHDQSTASPSTNALKQGYAASFWTIFGSLVVACAASMWGLRHVGKVGEKMA